MAVGLAYGNGQQFLVETTFPRLNNLSETSGLSPCPSRGGYYTVDALGAVLG